MPSATLGVLPNQAMHLTALRAARDRHDVGRTEHVRHIKQDTRSWARVIERAAWVTCDARTWHKLVLVSLAFLALDACKRGPHVKTREKDHISMTQPTIVQNIRVSGFDPDGGPHIRVLSDGTVRIVFEFMPPSFAEGNEQAFADFDKQLETAVGVPVEWEDRELFLIRKPTSDTVAKARAFLENYRRAHSK